MSLGRSLADGVRALARSRGNTALSAGLLAAGLAAFVVAFSLLEGVLLKPLPYRGPEQLVRIYETKAGMYDRFSVAAGKYLIWERELRSFESLAMFKEVPVNLTGNGAPQRLRTMNATRAFFETLGATLVMGHGFDGLPDMNAGMVLTHQGWSSLFAKAPDVVGRTMVLDGRPFTIVGVLARDFEFSSREISAYTLWVPGEAEANEVGKHSAGVIGRLARGQSLDTANQELARVAEAIEPMFGRRSLGWSAKAVPLADDMLGAVRPQLMMAQVFALLLLAGTISSVVGLNVLRAAHRTAEFGIREALGANPRRLVTTCISEGLVLAGVSLLVALPLAALGTWYAAQVFSEVLPRAATATVGWGACAVAACAALGVGVVLGVTSARRLSRMPLAQLVAGARHGSRRDARTHDALLVGKVCLAFVLLAVGSTFWRSLERASRTDFGFSPDSVSYVRLSLPKSNYPDLSAVASFHHRMLAALDQSNLLAGTAIAQSIPIVRGYRMAFHLAGDAADGEDERSAQYYAVSPDYFERLGIRLVAGRFLSDIDSATSAPTALVSRAFAQRHFGGRDPIGLRVRAVNERGWREVVGVVEDVRQQAHVIEREPQVYAPIAQLPFADAYLVAANRTGSAAGLRQEIARVVGSVDPMLPVEAPHTLDEAIAQAFRLDRSLLLFSMTFGALTLLLAAAGLYATLSMAVHRDSRRIAIELAMGRTPGGVVKGVIVRGLVPVGIGCALGTAVSTASTMAIGSILPSLQRVAALDLALVGSIVLGICALACLLPSARAARIQPVRLLMAS